MGNWSRHIFLVVLSISFFSIVYLTFMERNSLSVQLMKDATDQTIAVKKTRSTNIQNITQTDPLSSKEMHNVSKKSEPTEIDVDIGRQNQIDPLFLKTLHHRIVEHVVHNISTAMIEPALQSLRLELIKNLYRTTYDKLLEAALQAKPITTRPRPRSMQVIIATTWRSGSTFLEELIESHPGMYNIYEPLLPFGLRNFYAETDPDAQKTQRLVSNLLKCKYDTEYIAVARRTSMELFQRNKKLWKVCNSQSTLNILCFEKRFLESACKIFPWTLMKLVRMGVRLLKPVLEDEMLNVHVLYLVRDPRAVTHSRLTSVHWCDNPLCTDPSLLCKHMEEDVEAVRDLSILYPGRVHLLRYEDLALSPMNVTKSLLDELELDFDPNMEKYIKTHTTKDFDKPWSTSRESSKRVTHWISKIDPSVLKVVQNECSNIMPKLGYKNINSTRHMSINDILESPESINL